jgi:hypothetical protein
MRRLIILMLLVGAWLGCSTLDGGDEAALEAKIRDLPPQSKTVLGALTAKAAAKKYLRATKPYHVIGGLWCQSSDGRWERASEDTWQDMLDCLLDLKSSYAGCGIAFERHARTLVRQMFVDSGMFTGPICEYRWTHGFSPGELPSSCDPERVTLADEVEALVGMPAPPPGFAIPELIPYLCPLSPGWCPPRPDEIGAGSSAASSGDYR